MASELVWFPHPTRCYALGAVTNRAGDKISLRDTGAAPGHGTTAAAGAVPVPGSPNLTVGGGAGAGESHTVATDKTLACDPTHLTDVDGARARGGEEKWGRCASERVPPRCDSPPAPLRRPGHDEQLARGAAAVPARAPARSA